MKHYRSVFISIGVSFVIGISLGCVFTSITKKPIGYYFTNQKRHPHCGIVAVLNMCLMSGVDTNMSEVASLTGISQNGVSLQSCMNALDYYGIPVTPIRYKKIEQMPESTFFIAVLRSTRTSHAVLAIRRDDQIMIIDGRQIAYFESSEFDLVNEGVALVCQEKHINLKKSLTLNLVN